MVIHEDIEPGTGLSESVRSALLDILRCIVPTMFKAQEPWALIGSTASVLQGLPDYCPPDIDLATTRNGAYIMEGCISQSGATLRPVGFSTGGPYTSYFGIFEVRDVKVEVMGDLVIHCDDGELRATDHFSRWSEKVRILHFEGLHLPVVPLEWQLVANSLLARPERVDGIAAYLLRCGYDRAYLDTLLADQKYGARTLRMVREALRIEQ
jgi:hypothetical protein